MREPEPSPKVGSARLSPRISRKGSLITFYGDNHPVYAGNVVKAMASARDGYPYIVRLFEREIRNLDPGEQRRASVRYGRFRTLDESCAREVVEVKRLTPTIIEVDGPCAHAERASSVPASSIACKTWRPWRPPSKARRWPRRAWPDRRLGGQGKRAHIAHSARDGQLLAPVRALETGRSAGSHGRDRGADRHPLGQDRDAVGAVDLGNAVLFSIGKALRAAGNQVIYFAGYRNREDVFKVAEVEAASDVIVWSVDPTPAQSPSR